MKIKDKRYTRDIWLRFDAPGDEEPSHEANILLADGDVIVEWYHVSVGQVTEVKFTTVEAARAWLESAGYLDFTN